MIRHLGNPLARTLRVATALLLSTALCSCGDDDGTGPGVNQTGAVLRGQIIHFASAAITADLGMFSEPVSGVSVAVAGNSTTTDANGNFVLTDLPLGNQTVVFSGSGIRATYALQGVEQDSVFDLWSVQVNGSNVTTEHTGTWVGTAGSDDPNSAGQIAFTLTIAANGNALSGTGTLAPPDASVWTMTGLENGRMVTGVMTLVSSNSSCATGGAFTGTFVADTLSGDFVEIAPPAGCGPPESGRFRVVKQ